MVLLIRLSMQNLTSILFIVAPLLSRVARIEPARGCSILPPLVPSPAVSDERRCPFPALMLNTFLVKWSTNTESTLIAGRAALRMPTLSVRAA